MYRYISRETCSQFDSLPLTSLTMKARTTTAAYSHWAWVDSDAVLGDLAGSLAGGADLAAFDVLSFAAPGAPHVALGASLSIFRNDEATSGLWRAVAPETLRAVFAPDGAGEADGGAPPRARGDFATFRASNAVVFAPRASGVRVKIVSSAAAPPAFVAARVASGAAAGSLVAAPSSARAAAALAQNTAAAFEAGERRAAGAAATWRRVALRTEGQLYISSFVCFPRSFVFSRACAPLSFVCSSFFCLLSFSIAHGRRRWALARRRAPSSTARARRVRARRRRRVGKARRRAERARRGALRAGARRDDARCRALRGTPRDRTVRVGRRRGVRVVGTLRCGALSLCKHERFEKQPHLRKYK